MTWLACGKQHQLIDQVPHRPVGCRHDYGHDDPMDTNQSMMGSGYSAKKEHQNSMQSIEIIVWFNQVDIWQG